MDVSLQEDVQMATLEELFEFIDCCVCPMGCLKNGETELRSKDMTMPDCCVCPKSCVTNAGACANKAEPATKRSVQDSPTATDRSGFRSLDPNTQTKRRRKRTGWSSSTGLQRRKRAEIEFLREHVRDLEAYVEQLKQRVGLVQENKSSWNWQDLAVAESMERLKAEETNRKLKEVMNSQLHVSTALKLFAEQSTIT